ncbi:MAG: STAS domain-containing protein [Bacteroidota bacterium]
MRFEKIIEDRFTVIKLLEEKVDSRISPQLKSEFIQLNAQGTKNIVLNMGGVSYVDSSGLSAILTANRLCGSAGGVLVVTDLNPHVEKLIKISHLESVLNVLPTETEGREAVYMMELENEIQEEEKDSKM